MNHSLARALIIILLIPYGLLLVEFLSKEVSLENIIKVFAAIYAPIPLAIFIAYLLGNSNKVVKSFDETQLTVLASVSYLLVTLFSSIIFLYLFESFLYKDFSHTVIPIFFNSFILAMYIFNMLFTKSIKMIAVLSGLGIGISIYVLFLT